MIKPTPDNMPLKMARHKRVLPWYVVMKNRLKAMFVGYSLNEDNLERRE